jgi:hypothetical protein
MRCEQVHFLRQDFEHIVHRDQAHQLVPRADHRHTPHPALPHGPRQIEQ